MFRATVSIVGRTSSVNHHHHNKRGAIVLLLVEAMENSIKSASSSSSDVVSSSRWDSLRTTPPRHVGGRGSTTTYSRRHFHGDRQGSQQQSPQHQQQQKQHAQNNNNSVTIISNDFTAYHKLCQATRYKVHAPNCTCRKVGNLYTRPLHLYNNSTEGESVRVVAAASLSEAVTTKNENDDDDCSKLLSQLDLKSTATTSPITTTITPDILNNLIVLPDTQSTNPKYIYVCTDTHSQAFQYNWKQCENKLANEIFNNNNSSSSSSSSINLPSFKVSCAVCLLQYQSNGFAAILSPTIANILPTITAAKQNAQRLLKSKKVLHADHAHFLCAIELSVLQQLVAVVVSKSTSTTNDRMVQVCNTIVRQIEASSSDGGSYNLTANNNVDNDVRIIQQQSTSMQIKLGHHITSFLHLLAELPRGSNNNDDNDSNSNLQYIMLLGYNSSIVDEQQQQQQQQLTTTNNNKTNTIKLDLPGGKRHLGESTLYCVQREIMEECSLVIQYNWLFSRVSMQYGGGIIGIGDDDRLTSNNKVTVIVGGRRMAVSRSHDGDDGTTTTVDNKKDDAFVHVLTSKGNDCHDVFFVTHHHPPPSSHNINITTLPHQQHELIRQKKELVKRYFFIYF
jgi:hypothetical protein